MRLSVPTAGAFAVLVCCHTPVSAQEKPLPPAAMPAFEESVTVPADAAAPVHTREWFGARPWTEWTTLSGDWNSTRSWLTGRGIDVAVGETADVSNVRSTGDRRTFVTRGLFETSASVDLARVLRIPGARAFAQFQSLRGGNGSLVLGDAQGTSNIDAERVPHLGELWYEQQFGSRVRAKVGRVDANSEFAYVDAAGDFLSSSMGFSPSIAGMPTYPIPSSSLSVFVQPHRSIEVGAGLFNGMPDDGKWINWDSRFAIAQVGARWSISGSRAGRATFGGWQLRNRTGEDGDASVAGLYMTAEQTVWAAEERSASAFVQVGTSDAHCDFQRHVGGGVAITGMMKARAADVTGVGATWVRVAPQASELVLEVFQRIALTPSLSVIPDLQIVRDPSGDTARGRTAAFTCRVRVDF